MGSNSNVTVRHKVELLKMQMKMELNGNFHPETPGRLIVSARKALEIIEQTSTPLMPDEANACIECQDIIARYIRCLALHTRSMVEKGLDKRHSGMLPHSIFLNDLYKYDPKWVAEKVEQYPHAFINIDGEWCAWVTLLK